MIFEWRIFDLHIHKAKSTCQDYKNVPRYWGEFIEFFGSLTKEFKIIGITDFYFIGGFEKVNEFKAIG